ncbi:hypothetical protein ZWY2020_027116 [Hordeum vulgare]|nr:hypothetical protein ZWY2020_027116 [Hordeum vulgare]
MAAPVPPPAKKRKKGAPTRLETSPLLPAAGWSALPPDLVRRLADSLLATNDLDNYMDYRAVCSGWRAATDPRFRVRRWIILGEVFPSQGEEMLLLNTDSDRFLRKKPPPLSVYHAVATTHNGYLVLAEKRPPHTARVLNPLSGVGIRFVVPVPPEVGSADVVFDVSSCNAADVLFFPEGLVGHMLVMNAQGSISVFRKQIDKFVALDNISNYVVFIGHQRSLAIDATKFPGIDANCVYYTDILGSSAHICKCNIRDKSREDL